MPKIKRDEQRRILAPTSEEIRMSRERIHAIIRETKNRRHPFTRNQFEAFRKTVIHPLEANSPKP